MKLSKPNLKLLQFINENPGLTQVEITNKIKISKTGISTFVKNAKKDNLILIIQKEQKIKIHPTKLGKDIAIAERIKTMKI